MPYKTSSVIIAAVSTILAFRAAQRSTDICCPGIVFEFEFSSCVMMSNHNDDDDDVDDDDDDDGDYDDEEAVCARTKSVYVVILCVI